MRGPNRSPLGARTTGQCGGSNDTLVGGFGDDTYIFKRGGGWDWIEDADGLGSIWLGRTQLTSGTATDTSFQWKSGDGTTTYQFTTTTAGGLLFNHQTGTLTITGGGPAEQILAENNVQPSNDIQWRTAA